MSRLRILVLGPDCNPECVSIPFVSYCHAAALAQLHDVTLVAGAPVEDALRHAKAPFRAIEVVRMPFLERLYAWSLRWIFKYNYDTQALTALLRIVRRLHAARLHLAHRFRRDSGRRALAAQAGSCDARNFRTPRSNRCRHRLPHGYQSGADCRNGEFAP